MTKSKCRFFMITLLRLWRYESFNRNILTAEQINNLKDDIIWYVEEEVNGVKVLVPKVYPL